MNKNNKYKDLKNICIHKIIPLSEDFIADAVAAAVMKGDDIY